MKTKFSFLSFCLLAAAMVSLGSDARADLVAGQTVGVDFNGSAATTGTNFNAFGIDTNDGASASLATGTLIDLTGATVSNLGFTFLNETGQNTERADFNTQGAEGTLSGPLSDMVVYQDAIISNNQGGAPLDPGGYFDLTFTGLDDALVYDVTGGFDNNGANSNFDAIWSSGGQSFTTLTSSTDPAGAGYGTLSSLTTDGSGNLTVRVTRNTLHVTVGGLTLTGVAVPEPSSLALLGLAAIGIVARRRK